MLADKLDCYKERGNKYVDDNIREIQELYIEEEKKEEKGKGEDEEVILIKPYKISITISSPSTTSFITDKVKNLIKYMKFVQSPTQTRLFKLPPLSRSLTVDFTLFSLFIFILLFISFFIFIFLFLEQLGLGFISHAVTSVTN